jgi:predicted phage terminase large subunit-like protein
MGLRLGAAKLVWSSTPKPVPVIREAMNRAKKRPDKHIIVRSSTIENAANLAPAALEEWLAEYGGTRLGRQELDGELLEDTAGAIFLHAWIDKARSRLPERHLLRRVVVSVDPAITRRKGADLTGIVVLALGFDGLVYVISDLSGRYAPEQWAKIVIDAVRRHGADTVIAEQNRGGELVAANLRAVDRSVPVTEVHARRGKDSRALPVATRYEKGHVVHVVGADLRELEEQMTTWDPNSQDSPDRVDALVHGVWELAALGRDGGVTAEYSALSAPSRLAAAARLSELKDHSDDDEDGDLPGEFRW